VSNSVSYGVSCSVSYKERELSVSYGVSYSVSYKQRELQIA